MKVGVVVVAGVLLIGLSGCYAHRPVLGGAAVGAAAGAVGGAIVGRPGVGAAAGAAAGAVIGAAARPRYRCVRPSYPRRRYYHYHHH